MIVNPVVVPSVVIAITSGTNPLCSGSYLTFTATPTNGGITPIYQWQVNGLPVGTNSATFTSSTLLNNDIVTCSLTSNSPCASPITAVSSGITIAVNSVVVPSVVIAITSGTNPLCAGSAVTYTATQTNGGTTPIYQWQVNGLPAGTNSATFTSSTLLDNDIVTCNLISSETCANPTNVISSGITMVVNPVVVPSVEIAITSGTNPLCLGSYITFTATPTNGGTTPVYQWQVNGVPAGINSAIFTSFTLLNNDVVTCNITSDATCASPTTAISTGINMIVNSIPVASVSNDGPYCEGTSIQLHSSGGTDYAWSGPLGFVSNDQNPLISGTSLLSDGVYSVIVTSANCSSTISTTVVVNPLPTLSTTTTLAACGSSNGTATVIASGGTGTYNYLWDAAAGDQQSALAINLGVGNYSVTVSDGNCTSITTASVSENGAPSILISASNTTICDGQTSTLTASGADMYLWTPSTYLSATTGSIVDATPPINTTYTVQGTTGGCSSVATIDIIVNALPAVYAGVDQEVCEGVLVTLVGSNADLYAWDNGVTDGAPFNQAVGTVTYTLTGTTNGCSNTDQVIVTVNPLPVAGFSFVDNGLGNVTFTDLSQNATSWNWSFGDGGSDIIQSPSYTYNTNGSYIITQTVNNACGSNVSTQTINMVIDNINVVSVSSLLEVFPNPSNGHFNIKYSSSVGNSFVINIVNVTGEVVSSKEYTKNSTSIIVPVDLAKLAKGIYQIKVINSKEVLNTRIMIDRY
jgi:PKD repeat protein